MRHDTSRANASRTSTSRANASRTRRAWPWLRIVAMVCVVLPAGAGCASRRSSRPAGPADEAVDRYPRDASRFDLRPLTDSTLAFAPAEVRWVRAGMDGIAVDPVQGDALVARFRVLTVTPDSVVGLVTGQTTRLAAGQVVLLVPPARPWWRDRLFWWGAAAGAGVLSLALLGI